jgi:DNA polymerase III delta subunit
MTFSEFRQYKLKQAANVVAFVCEDDFLVEESRAVWPRLFGGDWVIEKYQAKEFEEIPAGRLMDDALTASLFGQNRILIVTNAEKITKGRMEDLVALQGVANSSLRVVLAKGSRKAVEGWAKAFPVVIEIDTLKLADVARWLIDRYKLSPDVARYLVDNVGANLHQLRNEVEKLQTYVGSSRPIEARDVDVLILRSERFGPFELDDAVIAGDYKKAVQVIGSMLDEGVEPLIALSRIVRVWRQLFVGKSLAGKRGGKEAAAAVSVPAWKAAAFTSACKKYQWRQLAAGFRLLMNADRAFKTSTPNLEGYFDVMLWKMMM